MSQGLRTGTITAQLILFTILWVVFAPVEIGGWTSYVIVSGNSMEPVYHRDDLVIIRQAADYAVGDIVTYRHPQIGPVIHRILAFDQERYTFKGDHNTWLDSYRPRPEELLGKSWLLIPGLGKAIRWLRTPPVLAVLAALTSAIFLATLLIQPRPRAKRARRQGPPAGKEVLMKTVSPLTDSLYFALAAIACLALAMALFSFSRPLQRSVADDLAYTQSGSFSYASKAAAGIYDSRSLHTGDPVYLQAACQVDFKFDYHLATERPADLSGSIQLGLEVHDANGWERHFTLQPPTAFQGPDATASGGTDLCAMQQWLEGLQHKTGVQRSQYSLLIVPLVKIKGSLAGRDFQDSYSPALSFQLDHLQAQLSAAEPDRRAALRPEQAGLLKGTRQEANTLSLFSHPLRVADARQASALTLLACLALAAALWRLQRSAPPRQADELIAARYASLLVPLAEEAPVIKAPLLVIDSIEALARLAELHGQAILVRRRPEAVEYLVLDGGLIYSYTLALHSAAQSVQTPAPLARWLDALPPGLLAAARRLLERSGLPAAWIPLRPGGPAE